jgi:hypothetical protein
VKPELQDLLKELYTEVAHEWEGIGIILGRNPGKLDAIKTTENNRAQSCLLEMLKIWVKKVSPPPSWAAIADAIDRVGHQSLAEHLRNTYRV